MTDLYSVFGNIFPLTVPYSISQISVPVATMATFILKTSGGCLILHSMPNVLVSSTASRSFSYNISGVGYGGKSSRLKQV
jgi:hypothetical protein